MIDGLIDKDYVNKPMSRIDQIGLNGDNDGQGHYVEDIAQDLIENEVRSYNVGKSDYAKYKIQPWDIWLEYNLNPWDADIVKRVLRNKENESRRVDYVKIIHVCKERIIQIDEI